MLNFKKAWVSWHFSFFFKELKIENNIILGHEAFEFPQTMVGFWSLQKEISSNILKGIFKLNDHKEA